MERVTQARRSERHSQPDLSGGPELAARWSQKRQQIINVSRIICGLLCLYDASQKWQPNVAMNYQAALQHAASTSFSPAAIWFSGCFSLAHLNIYLFFGSLAVLEIVLGICLIGGLLTNLSCSLGIALTLTGGIGSGYLPGTRTLDYGVLIIALLIFAGLNMGNAGQPFGIDRWLQPVSGHWSILMSRSTRTVTGTANTVRANGTGEQQHHTHENQSEARAQITQEEQARERQRVSSM